MADAPGAGSPQEIADAIVKMIDSWDAVTTATVYVLLHRQGMRIDHAEAVMHRGR